MLNHTASRSYGSISSVSDAAENLLRIRRNRDDMVHQSIFAGEHALAFVGVLLFSIVYFGRPEDWIPGAGMIPFAKIAGALATLGVLGDIAKRSPFHFPKELLLLLLLFCQLCLALPFSTWKGGSFEIVINQFSKVVIITFVLVHATSTWARLRALIFVHVLAVLAITLVSSFGAGHVETEGRLFGAVGGIFANPNDLALNLALVLPLCVFFLTVAQNTLVKTAWLAGLACIVYTVIATYSRSGFLSSLAAMGVSLWYFGIKQGRYALLVAVMLVATGLFAIAPGRFAARMHSIVDSSLDENGSFATRRDLLNRSVEAALKHPLVGGGPGQFAEVAGGWHVAHNSYTELAAEAGFPALLIFLLMLGYTFGLTGQLISGKSVDPEYRLAAAGLRASLVAFVIAAFFASYEYHFFPYLLLGYVSALRGLVIRERAQLQAEYGTVTQPQVRCNPASNLLNTYEG